MYFCIFIFMSDCNVMSWTYHYRKRDMVMVIRLIWQH